jgi:MSHA biogenesis protein MshQ
VLAASFDDGTATIQPIFKFTSALTAPQSLALRATGQDTVNSANSGTAAPFTARSGRLRLSNVFGNLSQNLEMKVQAEYWTGQSWFLNAADNLTAFPQGSVVLVPNGPVGVVVENSTPITLVNGQAWLTLRKPTSGRGTVDVALNLGDVGSDNACIASHPASTAAQLSWLRSRNGSCATAYDRDPKARASFGLPTPESRATVHFREVFN